MMREKSRTYNSIVNSLFGIFAAIISVALNFAVRVFIVRALGEEINGLHNLFQNTINVFALMESGIASAMIIHLYEPVKDNNTFAIKQLLKYYKKLYLWIASAFLLFGIIIDVFFMDYLVSSSLPIIKVQIYFLLFSLSFFFNYLTYYKRSILFADQKNRISIVATLISEVVFRGSAIVAAVYTHEYMYFLILMIAEKLVGNAICIIYINKKYPYLRSINVEPIDKNKKQSIFATIKPLLVNQIAGTVQKSSNSILISILLGNIAIVGYYGNYQLVISAVELLFSQMGGAFTTSFGNLATFNNKDNMYNAYRKTAFVIGFIAIVVCSGFISCVQPFIKLVFGINYILPLSTVFVLTGFMFINLINIPIISIQNAMGLHRKDAIYMIIQAVLAVLLGYFGGKAFGMNGILVGLNIPTIVFTLFNKGIIITKVAFEKSVKSYLSVIAIDLVKACVVCTCVFLITNMIHIDNTVGKVFINGIVALLVSTILFIILSINNHYFISFKNALLNRIK